MNKIVKIRHCFDLDLKFGGSSFSHVQDKGLDNILLSMKRRYDVKFMRA